MGFRCLHRHWISIWSLITLVWSFSLPNISSSSSVILGRHKADSAILVSSSSQINVTCGPEVPDEAYDEYDSHPSILHDLRVAIISTDEGPMLNISWAVKVDASINTLIGLQLDVSAEETFYCQYNPSFKSVSIRDADVLWFSYTVQAEPDDHYVIVAHNSPEPPIGSETLITRQASISTPGCDNIIMMSHPTCSRFKGTTRQPKPSESIFLDSTDSAIVVSSSSQINVTCGSEVPPGAYDEYESHPSILHNLRVALISTDEGPMLNISWAVKVDASINTLIGLELDVSAEVRFYCQYNPSFKSVSIRDADVLWFSYTAHAEPDYHYFIVAHNLPEPPYGSETLITRHNKISTPGCDNIIMMSHPTCRRFKGTTRQPSDVVTLTEPPEESGASWIVSLVMLAMLLAFAIGVGLYVAHSGSLSKVTPEVVPVSVLMVYPAVDGVFQRAVLALADFLQSGGACSVAIDVWQRGRLAELGTLRWLHTVAESANRVLVVLPGHATHLDESMGKLLTPSQVEHTVPASAYELYPLALKMLSQSKLWVVRLGKTAARSSVPVELRGCRSFALLEDLQKLLHGLCAGRTPVGAPWLRSWWGGGRRWQDSDTALDKLKEVVQQLEQWAQSKSCKGEALQIVTV
ncbi:interleukin-17 receptor B isoform X2 [Sardina pilchardus]|uniref:interleukin-17 receptor B isoform X2 n=1 Tax=Sardina pilchardus TaxID=27697 RepID=UPI002E0F6063